VARVSHRFIARAISSRVWYRGETGTRNSIHGNRCLLTLLQYGTCIDCECSAFENQQRVDVNLCEA